MHELALSNHDTRLRRQSDSLENMTHWAEMVYASSDHG